MPTQTEKARATTAAPLTPSATPLPARTATIHPSPTITLSPSPAADQAYFSAGRVSIPILMYHHVNDTDTTRYAVRIKDFRAQMQTLADEGYQTITISQMADVIRNGGNLPRKPVVLTFDDGYDDTFQNAFPILQEHGFIGVVYVITGTLGTDKAYGYIQEAALKTLAAAGWEIGSHSITHSDLMKNPKLGTGTEIQKSKQDLESRLGVPVRSFSYPYGSANKWIEERVEEYGYDSAVGVDMLVNNSPKRLYFLSRREVMRSLRLDGFRALLVPGKEEIAANTPAAPMTP